MRPRYLVFITLLGLCHQQLGAQRLTDSLPPGQTSSGAASAAVGSPSGAQSFDAVAQAALPDDPGQEILPIAQPEPVPPSGIPIRWDAQHQTQNRADNTWTLSGDVVIHYRDYILRADKVVYHQSTSELEAEGHLQVTGGPEDILIQAAHGDMRLDMHTARFYNVNGSIGLRRTGRTMVYSTTNPFLFSGRVLLQLGEGRYRMIDGSMTNCRLPRPDWTILAHSISLENGVASAAHDRFKFLGIPIFYLPYLRHPTDTTGRESGFLIPVLSSSTVKGFTVGEQYYWAISRSMDMVVGSEYYSKRGFAPNGDFRYKGAGFNHLTARWNALLDRGVETPSGLVNQGGVDIYAVGRRDLSPDTRLAGNVEYLSSYIYRLVFNDNYSQAVSSQVQSSVSLTHVYRGMVPSASLERYQTFASSTSGDEARILHLPNLRFDVVDQPLGRSPVYWGVSSSLGYLGRSVYDFHARNVGRLDIYPHISLPFVSAGWSVIPQVALRDTSYTISQTPNLTGANRGNPTISHDSLMRRDAEVSVDLRPPAVARDFSLDRGNTQLRHVIEPEITYRYVRGIGRMARNVLQMDTTDIATDTNEIGYSLTQRFFVRSGSSAPCPESGDDSEPSGDSGSTCSNSGYSGRSREWASWQIAQKYFFDPKFGGALISGRRNVFDATLDLSGVSFLTGPRNLAPVVSRLRFEAIDRLRIQWDLDYDPKEGRLSSDNIYAGYSWGQTTIGVAHALLNAVDEKGSRASLIQSNELVPFITIGKPSRAGFNLAANGSYDLVNGALQYGGVQAVYNWDCCGITMGYRRFSLGSVRNETQWLYSFTLANFGSVGDIRRANSVFRDPNLPPAY